MMTVDLASPSVGLDRRTGRIITGWAHVEQSLEDIFTTRFGERLMREFYGSVAPHLLGRSMTPGEILSFFAGMSAAIEQFEPRVKIANVNILGVERLGTMRFELDLLYRPRATSGDFTVEGARRFASAVDASGRIASAA